MPGHTTKRLTDADVDTLFELVRVSLDDKSMLDWHERLREIRDKMVETIRDTAVETHDAEIRIPYPGDLNTIETAVWAAEYVRYLAARSTSTERWPPDVDDVDDAVDDANETVAELRAKDGAIDLLDVPAKWAVIFDALCVGLHAAARGEALPEIAVEPTKATKRSPGTK